MVNIIKELATFIPPAADLDTLEPPLHVGDQAPDIYVEPKGRAKRGYIVAFLRHIGCPFCEKTFLELRNLALLMPKYHYIAVSHGSIEATEKWCALIGGHANVQVITDDSRHLYSTWGLPLIGFRHLIDPRVFSETKRLGQEEGIFPGRVTSSGSRWQGAGAFAILFDHPNQPDINNKHGGTVVYAHQAKHAADVPELKTAIKALEAERRKRDVKSEDPKRSFRDGQSDKETKKRQNAVSPRHLISEPALRARTRNPSPSLSLSSVPSSPNTSDSDISSPPSSVSVISPPTSGTNSPPLSTSMQQPPTLNPMLASTLHSSSSVPTVASPAFSASSNSSMESVVKPHSQFPMAKSVFRPAPVSTDSTKTNSSQSSSTSTSSVSSQTSNTSASSASSTSNSHIGDFYKMQPKRRKSSTSAHNGASAEFVINRLSARAAQ